MTYQVFKYQVFKTCHFIWCLLVIWRYWQPCEETSECSGDLECVRRPGGRWGDLKVIMLLAKKVMEADWDLKWRFYFEGK